MSQIINLSETYEKCLAYELSKFLLIDPPLEGKLISHEGKKWNVLVDVKSDESATFIRAESGGDFHIWNCIKHPTEKDRIRVFHFNGPLTSDYTIAYDTTGQKFSKLLIEGTVLGPEESFQLAEKTADLAMGWIQQQGLEACCKKLTGRKFTPPKGVSIAPESRPESSPVPYPPALKLIAIALAFFLSYKVASFIFGRFQSTDHLTGIANDL